MQKKNIHIMIIVLLAVGWALTLGLYSKLDKEIRDIRSGTAVITQQEDAFTICEKIDSLEDEQACVDQLVRFSGLLKKYEQKLRTLNIQG